jgi:hypothetical protein
MDSSLEKALPKYKNKTPKIQTHGLKDQLVSSDQNLGITQLTNLALDGTCTVGF